jgi:hypothetical protein
VAGTAQGAALIFSPFSVSDIFGAHASQPCGPR